MEVAQESASEREWKIRGGRTGEAAEVDDAELDDEDGDTGHRPRAVAGRPQQLNHLYIGEQVGKVERHREQAVARVDADLHEGALGKLGDERRGAFGRAVLLLRLLLDWPREEVMQRRAELLSSILELLQLCAHRHRRDRVRLAVDARLDLQLLRLVGHQMQLPLHRRQVDVWLLRPLPLLLLCGRDQRFEVLFVIAECEVTVDAPREAGAPLVAQRLGLGRPGRLGLGGDRLCLEPLAPSVDVVEEEHEESHREEGGEVVEKVQRRVVKGKLHEIIEDLADHVGRRRRRRHARRVAEWNLGRLRQKVGAYQRGEKIEAQHQRQHKQQ